MDDTTVKFFGVQDEEYAKSEVLGMSSGYLVIGGAGATKALFTEIDYHNKVDGSSLELLLDDRWNKPAPADHSTLAGRILRNLAYAPDTDRIDLALLEDARRKQKMREAFVASEARDYDTAIKRLRS